MRIGFRLFVGFGFMLALLFVLVALGWEGQRRLTEAQSVLVRRSTLEADIRTMQAGALSLMIDPKPGALDAVLARSGTLDESFSAFKMHVEHDMGVRIDKAMRANIEFRGAVERWQAVADARSARVTDAENVALTFSSLFAELAGKKRDAAFVHSDGYASADLVNARFDELRKVNDIQREFYEARLLSREWQKTGESQLVDDIRTHMATVMSALTEIRGSMTALADKDMADTLLAHGRDYLAALSDLEDSTASLNEVRSTLATAVTDMHEPMNMLADKYQAAIDYVQDIATLAVGGVLALGLFVSLLFTVTISSGVRKRLEKVKVALDALGAGECPTRDNGGLSPDMGILVDSIQRVAMGEADLAERVKSLANGNLDVSISPRSEKDVLGLALMQVVESERAVRDALLVGASGDFHTAMTPRSSNDEVAVAILRQQQFISGKINSIRQGSGVLRELAGKAMDSLKALEHRMSVEAVTKSGRDLGPIAKMVPRFEAACAAMKGGGKAVHSAAQDGNRLKDALERLDSSFKTLMSRATFSEDVARQIETLAINMNIEAARAGEGGAGVQAIVAEMRAVVDRCRENSISVNELLYSGRRASDDVALVASGVFGALDLAVQTSGSDIVMLEQDLAILRDLTQSSAATETSQNIDIELQKLAAGLGKAFSGIVMELNTLRSTLDAFSTGNYSDKAPSVGAVKDSPPKVGSKDVPNKLIGTQVRSMPPLRLGKAKSDFEQLDGDEDL